MTRAEAEANARLIAVAPQMLAILDELNALGPSEELTLKARAALDAARGEGK